MRAASVQRVKAEIPPDPFQERRVVSLRRRMRLLGGDFSFECGNLELARLVDQAYQGLPAHKLPGVTPRFRISLALAPRELPQLRGDPPRIEMLSGAGFLCGTAGISSFAAISPDSRSALVVVSREMLAFPYHTRYELLEFAVFTLASRAQGLIPLHAASVGCQGRGLVLLGDSGAGKTTTSLHCLLRGLDFVSEDSAFVTPDTLLITGVANFLHIRRDTLRLMPPSVAADIRHSAVIRRRSGVEKLEIDLRTRRYRLATRPLKLSAVVFASAETARNGQLLTPLRPREALARFRASQPYAASQPGWPRFRQRLDTTAAFELRRGAHPAETAEVLQRLLTR